MFNRRDTDARVWDQYALAALGELLATLPQRLQGHAASHNEVADACHLAAFAADHLTAARRRRTHPHEHDKSL